MPAQEPCSWPHCCQPPSLPEVKPSMRCSFRSSRSRAVKGGPLERDITNIEQFPAMETMLLRSDCSLQKVVFSGLTSIQSWEIVQSTQAADDQPAVWVCSRSPLAPSEWAPRARKMWCCWSKSRGGKKMIKGLEQPSYKEKLGELNLFYLKKRKLWGGIIATLCCLKKTYIQEED